MAGGFDATAAGRLNGALLPAGFLIAGAVALAAVLTAPLAAYVFMIALFGLPHVLCELRYCDERFSARLPREALAAIGTLLALLALARIAQATGLLGATIAVPFELFLGALLTGVAVRFMRARRMWGVLAGSALTLGIVAAPIATFLATAWLHNLTPLAFAWEIVPKSERTRALVLLAFPFFGLPLLIASGMLQALAGLDATAAPSLFDAGRHPLAAFIPPGLSYADALPFFSAAVAAQAMHYFAVIVVLPRLLAAYGRGSAGAPLLPWPSWRQFYLAVGAAALAAFALHASDYANARAAYGVAAALHSWLELPLFLLALGLGFTSEHRAPHREARMRRWPAPKE